MATSDDLSVSKWLAKVRASKPLIHNMTNLVVTNSVANALLALGASPVMAYAKQEVADMARISSALALNMGTLDEPFVEGMLIAGKEANEVGVPVVFDPVGVGATPYRNETASKVLHQLQLTVLRGNASEIGVLLGAGGEVRGVDAASAAENLPAIMQSYAKEHQCVVIATGVTDYVTDGETIWALRNGHPLMTAVTGTGCIATAVLGAFVGAAGRNAGLQTYAEACVAALTCYNIAGELAAEKTTGPGSFQAALFDALFTLSETMVEDKKRIDRISHNQ